MNRSDWEEWCDIIDEQDEQLFYEYLKDMSLMDVFWTGYEFCVADKLYKED